ncbi:chromosome segregation protein SMC [Bacillus proteolyticus]|uniref:Chromosome segregation protein SMC n=1 Tax=Bacillus proteolyticus TaxID=2026192 RepID=A0AA44KSX6_9BACI|nr:chromosome segregation protein SMC [Bacillus proteolyticus]OJE39918.1 chromosome segregation protein SMC [Bacillus proteolyticus]
MATEREIELAKQVLAKITAMEKKIDKLDGRIDKLDNRIDDSLEGSFKGLQATFENGFSDVRKGLNEIIEINKNSKSAKEIVEEIAGKDK